MLIARHKLYPIFMVRTDDVHVWHIDPTRRHRSPDDPVIIKYDSESAIACVRKESLGTMWEESTKLGLLAICGVTIEQVLAIKKGCHRNRFVDLFNSHFTKKGQNGKKH